MAEPQYFCGQFLLATPGMGDPRFERSVIALCSHDENGALGINVGDTSDEITFHGILKQFDIDTGTVDDELVFLGGPVESQRGFLLHSLDLNLSDTLQVSDRWGLSSSIEMLRAIARGRGPEKWLVALGYSGWGAGQLESELTQNGWSIVPGESDWLFDGKIDDRWQHAWRSQGIEVAKLSGDFGSA